jgi:hypothetical protein
MQLTDPQRRMLQEVRDAGTRSYNGRARRTLEALEQAGLVEYDYELVPHADGVYTERFTVTPVEGATADKPEFVSLDRTERARLLDVGRAAGDMQTAADEMFSVLLQDPRWEHLEAVVISEYSWAAAKFCFPNEAKYW